MSTPFRVGEHVTGEYFTDRSDEVARILRAMREPTRLLVYGERRQGKSSAIRQAGVRFAREKGLLVWIDVATASGFDDLARRLVSSVPYRWVWREDLQTRLVKASLRIEARSDPSGNPVLSLGIRGAEAARIRCGVEPTSSRRFACWTISRRSADSGRPSCWASSRRRPPWRAVAAGVEQINSRAAADEFGLPTAGPIRKAVLALAGKGHLAAGDELRIDDPFFSRWILMRAMPDGVSHEDEEA